MNMMISDGESMIENGLHINQCLEYFSEIIHTLKTTPQYERVFHLVVYRLARLFNCQTTAIVLIHHKTEYLTIYNSYGLSQTFCNEFQKNLATGAIGKLLWTGKPIIIPDDEQQSELCNELRLEHKFGSCICVQISIDHRTLGYLYADSIEKYIFGEKEIQLFQMFANLAGIAFYKFQLHEENLRAERIDRETGVEKYSPFAEKLKLTLDRAQKSNEHFSLLLLDIDNFKTITNTYGQETAGALLRELAEMAKSEQTYPFAIGRYGYDEFIILLENCCLRDAVSYAAILREKVEKTNFTNRGFISTISIGISSYPQNALTIDELLVTVKNALFEAQRTGKNKIFYYTKEWYSKENITMDSIS